MSKIFEVFGTPTDTNWPVNETERVSAENRT
jgi:hypothetical protein